MRLFCLRSDRGVVVVWVVGYSLWGAGLVVAVVFHSGCGSVLPGVASIWHLQLMNWRRGLGECW